MKKKILLTLLALSCISIFSNAQVINLSPATLIFNTPAGTTSAFQSVTISASGLTPASGYLVITVPIKYAISSGGSSYIDADTITYTGGVLPATTIGISHFSATGTADHISIPITGGGATANICVCDDNSACPCTSTSVAAATEEPSLTVLPNPVVNELIINSSSRITSVAISNLIGRTVYAGRYSAQKVQVDVAGLPKGVYLVRINDSEVRRFVKQ